MFVSTKSFQSSPYKGRYHRLIALLDMLQISLYVLRLLKRWPLVHILHKYARPQRQMLHLKMCLRADVHMRLNQGAALGWGGACASVSCTSGRCLTAARPCGKLPLEPGDHVQRLADTDQKVSAFSVIHICCRVKRMFLIGTERATLRAPRPEEEVPLFISELLKMGL